MNIDKFWSVFCCFVVRSALEGALFWIAQYYFLRWRGTVKDELERDELRLEIPLGPGEDLDTFGERKLLLGKIWRLIWLQQKYNRLGQKVKECFLDEIPSFSISRYGNAREMQGEIEALPVYEANNQQTGGVRRPT
jgi:hypothetical protein